MSAALPEGIAICGRHSRLNWLRGRLEQHFEQPGASVVQPLEIIGWYLRCGFDGGFSSDELLFALKERPDLLALAESASAQDISAGKPPPEFLLGQRVEVVVNARNVTFRRGRISDVRWHHKQALWHFFIEENGRHIGKRYEARDLTAVE
jgi:hypothetical protein